MHTQFFALLLFPPKADFLKSEDQRTEKFLLSFVLQEYNN